MATREHIRIMANVMVLKYAILAVPHVRRVLASRIAIQLAANVEHLFAAVLVLEAHACMAAAQMETTLMGVIAHQQANNVARFLLLHPPQYLPVKVLMAEKQLAPILAAILGTPSQIMALIIIVVVEVLLHAVGVAREQQQAMVIPALQQEANVMQGYLVVLLALLLNLFQVMMVEDVLVPHFAA
ncbi:MAG TPA: hypothetical protein VEW42_01825 [Candidatus Eisenbacteria bacterium]|nr:hypothetical protein [Candidatus Eisenbacteria bacterium]